MTWRRRRRHEIGPLVCVGGLLVFSLLLLGRAASRLPLWYDESLTVRLAKLGSLGELWRALTAGFEFNPPLIYIVTRAALLLPGPETLTARLPGLAGYALLTVSLFAFLRRRIGGWFAVAAVALLPLATYTVLYSMEARAYMLLLGVSSCALVCWQVLAQRHPESRSMRNATPGVLLAAATPGVLLTVTVATALLLHVWAILLPLALLVGEAIAFIQSRRIRWRIVAALAAAAPVIAIYPTLLRASETVIFGGPAYAPSLDKLIGACRLDVPRPRVIAGVLVAASLAGWWARRRGGRQIEHAPGFNAPELGVILSLLLSPIVPYVYASLSEGAFMARYALFALPAIVTLIGLAAFYLSGRRRLASLAAAGVALIGVVLYLPARLPIVVGRLAVIDSLSSLDAKLDPSVPVILVNPVDVTAFDEQANEALRSRAAFVADPDLALKYTGTNGIDLGYVRGEPYLKLRVERLSYGALTSGHSRLYLAGKWQALSWLPQRLKDDGWAFEEIGGTRQAPVFEARRTR